MPCNTAHSYFSQLKQCIQIPLLNIVDLTLARIPKSSQNITILATRPTIESQVYQKGLDFARLSYVLNPSWQKKIDEIILGIKSSIDHQTTLHLWEVLSSDFYRAEVDTVILACTDLNAVLDSMHSSLSIIDSSFCLCAFAFNKVKINTAFTVVSSIRLGKPSCRLRFCLSCFVHYSAYLVRFRGRIFFL